METFVCEDQRRLLALKPTAVCQTMSYLQSTSFRIVADGKLLGVSWRDEATAWQWALAVINNQLLHKFCD